MLKTLVIIWKESFISASLMMVAIWAFCWFGTFCVLVFYPGDDAKITFFVGVGFLLLGVICAGFELADYYKKKFEEKEDGEFIP